MATFAHHQRDYHYVNRKYFANWWIYCNSESLLTLLEEYCIFRSHFFKKTTSVLACTRNDLVVEALVWTLLPKKCPPKKAISFVSYFNTAVKVTLAATENQNTYRKLFMLIYITKDDSDKLIKSMSSQTGLETVQEYGFKMDKASSQWGEGLLLQLFWRIVSKKKKIIKIILWL